MTALHTLDNAIDYVQPRVPDDCLHPDTIVRLGHLVVCSGNACEAAGNHDAISTCGYLAITARIAMRWADALATDGESIESAADAVRREYDRAHAKHAGLTPNNPAMSNDDRAAILIEEVGEVARALTPDANTEVGHAGNLREELIQTATMALAWLARLLDDKEATR